MRHDGRALVDEVLDVLPSESRLAVLAVFRRWSGERVSMPNLAKTEAVDRVRTARMMLGAGQSRADVTRTLRDRFGVCRRQASRDAAEALKLGQKLAQRVPLARDDSPVTGLEPAEENIR